MQDSRSQKEDIGKKTIHSAWGVAFLVWAFGVNIAYYIIFALKIPQIRAILGLS